MAKKRKEKGKKVIATKKLGSYLVTSGALHLSLSISLRKHQLRHFSGQVRHVLVGVPVVHIRPGIRGADGKDEFEESLFARTADGHSRIELGLGW